MRIDDSRVAILVCANKAGEAHDMNKIILADSQVRAGTAKVLAMDGDFRVIALCADRERMMHAITTFPAAIVLFASLHSCLILSARGRG